MKSKFGAIIVDGRGKLGGHVMSKNRGGSYMRTKVTPVNPQSADQMAVRSAFTTISQAWRNLSDAERKSFDGSVNNFAKTDIFGDLRNPSGANLHQKLNLNLNSVGASFITTAPAVGNSPETPVFTLTAAGGSPAIAVAWSSGAIPAGSAVVIEATAPQSAGKSFVKNLYRQIQVLPAGDTTPTSLLAAYAAKFGNPVTGEKIYLRAKSIDIATGIAGAVTFAECTVS